MNDTNKIENVVLTQRYIILFTSILGVVLILLSGGLICLGQKISLLELFIPKLNLWLELMIGIGLGLFFSVTIFFIVRRIATFRDLFDWIVEVIFGPLNYLGIFYVSCIAGISEELFFRGGLQPLIGIIPTSVIFGLLHMGFYKKLLPYGLYAFGLSLVFGYLFLIIGDLYACILCHFMINFALGVLWKGRGIENYK
ncbi:MAG: CPBP family intramembrane glutamic endopeptidase [bacterium]